MVSSLNFRYPFRIKCEKEHDDLLPKKSEMKTTLDEATTSLNEMLEKKKEAEKAFSTMEKFVIIFCYRLMLERKRRSKQNWLLLVNKLKRLQPKKSAGSLTAKGILFQNLSSHFSDVLKTLNPLETN